MRRSLYEFMNIKPTIRITWLESPTHTMASVTIYNGRQRFWGGKKRRMENVEWLWKENYSLAFLTLSHLLEYESAIAHPAIHMEWLEPHTNEWLTNTQLENSDQAGFSNLLMIQTWKRILECSALVRPLLCWMNANSNLVNSCSFLSYKFKCILVWLVGAMSIGGNRGFSQSGNTYCIFDMMERWCACFVRVRLTHCVRQSSKNV